MKTSINILAYDNWKRVNATIDRFWAETDTLGIDLDLFVFYYDYPLPSPRENYEKILTKCENTGTKLVICGKNKGQDANLMEMAKLHETANSGFEVFVPYDTDVAPRNNQWLKDALKIFKAQDNVGAVSMDCFITDNSLKHQRPIADIGGVKVRQMIWHGGFPIVIMRQSWIAGRGFTQYHSYYGGTEYAILESLKNAGLIGVMMEEHDDGRNLVDQDEKYNEWKKYAIARAQAVSLEEWLEGKR